MSRTWIFSCGCVAPPSSDPTTEAIRDAVDDPDGDPDGVKFYCRAHAAIVEIVAKSDPLEER